MKKKIAILTQPLGYNYGGIIQNYALQYVLKDKGFSVETVRRESKQKTIVERFFSNLKNETYNRFKGTYRKIFSEMEKSVLSREMARFIEDRISVSEMIFNSEDLLEYFKENSFDLVIVGSDQTWRPKYSPDIYNFYLDFLQDNNQIKKIAYASSFGTEEWEYSADQTLTCSKLVKQFDAVSLREVSGVDLCKNHFNISTEWVLDPTMLLSQEQYCALFGDIKGSQSGLFNYVLDKEDQKQVFISDIAEKLGCTIYTNQPKRSLTDTQNFSTIDDYEFPSVEKWLKSFFDADFVVTDSFHGTVFSIIFNKPFLSIVNQERGASRFYSILEKFGLEDRLITDFTQFDFGVLNNQIDYERVNKILGDLRRESYCFLNKNLF